jgi:hypothetical protein
MPICKRHPPETFIVTGEAVNTYTVSVRMDARPVSILKCFRVANDRFANYLVHLRCFHLDSGMPS